MERERLMQKLIDQKVFWSYDLKSALEDIPLDVFIEKVILHLSIEDNKSLINLLGEIKVKRVFEGQVMKQEHFYHNKCKTFATQVLHIEDYEAYLEDFNNFLHENF